MHHTTKRQTTGFQLKEHSPGDSSNKTTLTSYTENNFNDLSNNKQFIQAKLVKTSHDDDDNVSTSVKQSTPNLGRTQRHANPHAPFKSSYDQLMNTTLTTDTDDDPDANSRRLLTNKVITSHAAVPNAQRKAAACSSFFPQSFNPVELERANANHSNTSTFASGSILSKSSLNMTNVTPLNSSLANNSQVATKLNNQLSSSEYENLSNNTLNDILANYPNHAVSNSNFKSANNLLQLANKPRQVCSIIKNIKTVLETEMRNIGDFLIAN